MNDHRRDCMWRRACEGVLHCVKVRLFSLSTLQEGRFHIHLLFIEYLKEKQKNRQLSVIVKPKKKVQSFLYFFTPLKKTREGVRNTSCQKDLRGEERGRGGWGILFWGKPCLQSLTQRQTEERRRLSVHARQDTALIFNRFGLHPTWCLLHLAFHACGVC